MRKLFAAALFVTALATPSVVSAQAIVYAVPPPTAMDVRAIAAANGVVAIWRLELDEGVWKIKGRDVSGRYVQMKIDPATGAVVDFYRDFF